MELNPLDDFDPFEDNFSNDGQNDDYLDDPLSWDSSMGRESNNTLKEQDDALLEDGCTVWLSKDELNDRKKDKELKAYIFGETDKRTTSDMKRSRNKCKCWVNGVELKDKLIIIGKKTEQKTKPPYFLLTHLGEEKDGRMSYRVELRDPEKTLKQKRNREDKDDVDFNNEGVVKKARGRTTQELLEELEKKMEKGSAMETVFLLLQRILSDNCGDTAYWHEVIHNEHRNLEARDVVGLTNDAVSLDLTHASHVSVVAYEEWVASERNPRCVDHDSGALFVYMGRTQVKVHPTEKVGKDFNAMLYVVPDGNNNGMGKVVSQEEVESYSVVVGLCAGYYEPPKGNHDYGVVDIIIFPSTLQRELLESLQKIRAELRNHSNRLDILESKLSKSLFEKGNEKFNSKNFLEAISLYTESIQAGEEVHRSLTNRCLCYIKLNQLQNALLDAQEAIRNNNAVPRGYERLAQIYKELGDHEDEGTVASAIALELDSKEKNWLLKHFPCSKDREVVTEVTKLSRALESCPVGGVVLLKGATEFVLPANSFQKPIRLVGWPMQQVRLKVDSIVQFFRGHFYGENIEFFATATLTVCPKARTRLRKCKIVSQIKELERIPGITVLEHATAQFFECILEVATSGGGILGQGSTIEMSDCEVKRCTKAGLELRKGAKGIVRRSRFHMCHQGVGVWLGASANFENCLIENNRNEGLLVQSGAKVNFSGGIIRHNGKLGITLQNFGPNGALKANATALDIKGCKIQDNMFWGINIDSGAKACIEDCDISYNKCGGIHLGFNYNGNVLISSCSISFNSGKGFRNLADDDLYPPRDYSNLSQGERLEEGLPDGEQMRWTRPAEMKNVHGLDENGEFFVHRRVEACEYCHGSMENVGACNCNQCPAVWCSTQCMQSDHRHNLQCDLAKSDTLTIKTQYVADDGSRNLVQIITPRLGTPWRSGEGSTPQVGDVIVIKVQTNENDCDENQKLGVYDRTRMLQGMVQSPMLWSMIMRKGLGVLGRNGWTSKKIFLKARVIEFQVGHYAKLEVFTEHLPPFADDW